MFLNEELLNEFCRVQDREHGCKAAFGCLRSEGICPLKQALRVAATEPKDRAAVALACESLLRAPLDMESRDRILGDIYLHKNRSYPRARILCELEEYLLHHILPDSCCIYWSEGEIKKIDIWEENEQDKD